MEYYFLNRNNHWTVGKMAGPFGGGGPKLLQGIIFQITKRVKSVERTIKMRVTVMFRLSLDLLIVYTSFFITFFQPGPIGSNPSARIFPMGLLIPAIVFYLFGLYSDDHHKNSGFIASSTVISVLFSQLSMFLFLDIFPLFDFSLSDILLTTVYQISSITGVHLLCYWAFHSMPVNKKTLILAENHELSKEIEKKLFSQHARYFSPSLITAEKREEWTEKIKESDIVILSAKLKQKNEVIWTAMDLEKEVLLIPEAQDLSMIHAEITHMNDVLLLSIRPPRLSKLQMVIKRLLDLIVSSILLIALSPVLLLLFILIPLTSKGPAIYKQERTGLHNRTFQIYKFRSMVEHAEIYTGPVLATEHDPRITKIGEFLRSTRLDEIPQLINVFKGEMSLVGPRPERPYFVNQFVHSIPGYSYRTNVKPGITGLAQIMGKYSSTAEEKMRFDLMYVFGYSLVLDFKILFQTIFVLLQREAAKGIQMVRDLRENGPSA